MSTIEIALICCAGVIPVVSLIILAPKFFKKKEKAEKKEEQPKAEKEQTPATKPDETKKPKEERIIDAKNYTADDFKGYLQEKQATISKPKRKFMEKDTSISLADYEDLDFDFEKPKKEETIKEQINNLSPELKAILFTDALNKKKF